MSNANTLLTSTQATINALSLTWGQDNTAIPVLVGEEALNRDGIDPTPLPNIWISPTQEGEDVDQAATGNLVDVVYKFEISIVASGNASFQTNLAAYQDIREQIRKALQRVYYSAVPGFWLVRVVPREILQRDLQRDNYDFSILQVHYTVTENAKAS